MYRGISLKAMSNYHVKLNTAPSICEFRHWTTQGKENQSFMYTKKKKKKSVIH